jgi:septal ring factor EnvC (AmiA/AmiB activator)
MYMNDYVTNNELKEVLESSLSKQTDEIVNLIHVFMDQVDTKFKTVESEIIELKESHNKLINTIDGFISRIDKYESELAARDNQFEKLLAWARKVSEKTGIPLEYL